MTACDRTFSIDHRKEGGLEEPAICECLHSKISSWISTPLQFVHGAFTLRKEPDLLYADAKQTNREVVCDATRCVLAGTTVKVPTVDGKVDLKVPAGTQPGTTLVMAKRGVPRLGVANARGDQQV